MTASAEYDPVVAPDRLRALSRLDLESPQVLAGLDVLARRASDLLQAPVGLVTVVLPGALYIAGLFGLTGWIAQAQGTPIEWAFCARVVRTKASYVIEDALLDPDHRDNPLVAVDGVRSYAGVPIVDDASGHVIGACCVIDFVPRHFTNRDTALLRHLAGLAAGELAATRALSPLASDPPR